jgi:peptidoglycan biosynthesis protein MviN/MurJ (putative lipid II flippase)
VSDSRMKDSIGDPASSTEVIVDQLADDVFGIPPNFKTGLLTALVGAAAGGISLFLYFYLRQPHLYISPDWLIFVGIGMVAGYFMRVEQPLIKALYQHETARLQQTRETTERFGS